MASTEPVYPRPDFQRSQLRWKSLNGPWNFLFDDEDVGLVARWQQQGLPANVALGVGGLEASRQNLYADKITQKIAAEPEKLIEQNTFGRDAKVNAHQKRVIQVPFVFQSPASGINDREVHEVLWYERGIEDLRSQDEKQHNDRVLLRFGAVDYEATVWINGVYVGSHRGGHVPFQFDVTEALELNPGDSTHRLTIRVYDSAYDLSQPRGKQYWKAKPESIFYTPSGGIWQSVWLEVVPDARIADSNSGTTLRSNDIQNGVLYANVAVTGRRTGQQLSVQIECSLDGVLVSTTPAHPLPHYRDYVKFNVDMRKVDGHSEKILKTGAPNDPRCWLNGVALWTPENPLLYDLKLRLFDQSGNLVDEVHTTTGMRSLEWTTGDGTFRLNGQPYFQALVLDQGYWRETFMTPPSAESLKEDIVLSKQMGFNGCRKHQKVEDPIFLYWADRLGFLVWGEMANAYKFTETYVERFNQEWVEAIKRDINHPCLITWTPVNESWGYPNLGESVHQRNHIRALYYITKSLDDTRSINDNCGWEHVQTDLTTFHDYSDGPQLHDTCQTLEGILLPKAGRNIFSAPIPGADDGTAHRVGAPVMCTEFGGVNIAPREGDNSGERDWGYTTASDPQDLLTRVEKLVMGVVAGGHICGFVYTQLTDIEQEVNGLYSFDRRAKLEPAKVKAVMDKAQQVYLNLQSRASGSHITQAAKLS